MSIVCDSKLTSLISQLSAETDEKVILTDPKYVPLVDAINAKCTFRTTIPVEIQNKKTKDKKEGTTRNVRTLHTDILLREIHQFVFPPLSEFQNFSYRVLRTGEKTFTVKDRCSKRKEKKEFYSSYFTKQSKVPVQNQYSNFSKPLTAEKVTEIRSKLNLNFHKNPNDTKTAKSYVNEEDKKNLQQKQTSVNFELKNGFQTPYYMDPSHVIERRKSIF